MLVTRVVVHVSMLSFDRDDAWVLRTVKNHRREKPTKHTTPFASFTVHGIGRDKQQEKVLCRTTW